ncbi:MAG: hypothetical protein NXI30_04065 [bacterium]|nr:hypothetical protein [bacterium]
MDAEFAQRVVNDFGAALGDRSGGAGGVSDTRELPHSKETIKAALIFALRFANDPVSRDQLKAGYVSLADWQDGVGDSAGGLNLSRADLDRDPVELAKMLQSQAMPSQELSDRVEAESLALQAELRRLGY